MSRRLSARTATLGGVALLFLGGLVGVTLAVTTPFSGCTEVGVEPGADTGFEFRGVADGNIVYSPDGVNECTSPLWVAAVPLCFSVGGVALVAYGRSARRSVSGDPVDR